MPWLTRGSARPSRRPQLALEQLEDRMLLAGNLIAVTEVPGRINYNLMEYTQQGAPVGSPRSIPTAPGATEYQDARGLTVDPSGNVNIFDGTLQPSLATLSASKGTWSFQTTPGWGVGSNITYGEVAAYKNYVFASNMQTLNGQAHGIVRFDSSGGSPVLFAPGTSSLQVTLGLDGQLYELLGNGNSPNTPIIKVYNPDTLQQVRTFTLQAGFTSDIRSIAVDTAGNVYAADWNGTVTKYNADGTSTGKSILLKVPQTSFGENLMNIALDTDGQIAVGGGSGEIFLTDESLSSARTISTRQWDVFVTFDHYIGGTPQTVTPSFENLAGPTITYGQSSVTLGGKIVAGTAIPPESVNITLNGVTKSAAINANDGTFSASFDTSKLNVSDSPYAITYKYPGTSNFASLTDTSKSLTVAQAVTKFSDLSSPTVVIGTPTVTLTGVVGSNSVLPVGQKVNVTVSGANGTVAKGSGVIGSDGHFSVTLSTAGLAVGSYTIQYSYAGDANFKGSSGTGTLQVEYAIKPLYDSSRPVHSGAALPIKLQVTDAAGNDLSSADLTVTAISIVGADGTKYTPQAKGNANPDNAFRRVGLGYMYNLDTAGLTSGKYTLYVKVGDDPVLHALTFVIA